MRSPPDRPAPLSALPEAAARAVRGVLTDIDDTLTDAGALDPQAFAALEALRAAGVPVIAITGRPKGWSEPFARDWPLEAIVAENGAVALFQEGGALVVEYAQDTATRATNARRLAAAAERVQRDVPGSRLARDSAGRVTDIAVDHSEFEHLTPAQIEQVVAAMRAEGLHATVSSIHVNGWYGDHDKLSGARWIVRRRLGRDLDAERAAWVYVGDSTNDQLMFGHFELSVGVANLMRFAAELRTWPAYMAPGERGTGFADVARRILEARR
jgi:HAD superfamily hydrolase (TIGR01484 family)